MSIFIEIMTLKFPAHFLMLASIANIGKNICFLLSGASRASINVHFAKRHNIGDISGKSCSQFTASTMLGVGIGMALTKWINIASLSQLWPIIMGLTVVHVASSYVSAKVIDEVHFNEQRAEILFGEFMKTGRIMDAREGNQKEVFYVPDPINSRRCRWILYGKHSIYSVITKEQWRLSMLKQLEKTDRQFIYYVQLLPKLKRKFKLLLNNNREYRIHINMSIKESNFDILKSYYLARLID